MIRVCVNGQTLWATAGERLSELLMREGLEHPHPCGGRGTCGRCSVLVDGKETLSCQYILSHDVSVTLPPRGQALSHTQTSTERATEHVCYVLDIGTTTLTLALVSKEGGDILRAVSAANPQASFGADVISRLSYCQSHGPDALQRVLLDRVRALFDELGGVAAPVLYVCGNTTMLHLLLGVDASPMGKAPYRPIFLEGQRVSGASLGLNAVQTVELLPGISAFVGADIVAGLCYVGRPPKGKRRLLIDLGTNAEIVLLGAERAVCTAAAAGPCLEGATISCGMSATPGAIYAYRDGRARTVGDRPACGLCGTGLIDAIAALLDAGVIDETGYMAHDAYPLAPGVTLTQEDVRAFQLAKAAIAAATETLMTQEGVSWKDVDRVVLSGGFSTAICIPSTVRTGLLPAAAADKCMAVGNSALLGTVRYACGAQDLSCYTQGTAYVDLAMSPRFTELFMSGMAFDKP